MKKELLTLYEEYLRWIIRTNPAIKIEANNFYLNMIMIAKMRFATFDGFMSWLELSDK